VRTLDAATASLLMNRGVLAVNQDLLGVPGRRVRRAADVEVWVKPLSGDAVAVALVNRGSSTADVTFTPSELGLPAGAKRVVWDLWAGTGAEELGSAPTTRLAPHATALLRIDPPASALARGDGDQLD
ncbi:MAG: hypothetical protein ACRDKG_13035, partial [Actinomycetota bacterium]